MANSNFVIQNGLTVGALTINAATGSISTTGSITVSSPGTINVDSIGVSSIAKNDSSIAINDTGTGSNVVISIDNVVEHVLTSTMTTLSTGLTVSGNIVPSANLTIDIGSASVWFNTFYGVSTQAKYADLAENYQADKAYNPGTVLMFGGAYEVTLATVDTTAVAGVVSTNPAHLMNGQLSGSNVVPLALTGRVPCMVIGPVKKGDMMVAAGFGYAKSSANPTVGQVIGKALEDFPIQAKGVIEVVVGRL
jgi:hypothetical protein